MLDARRHRASARARAGCRADAYYRANLLAREVTADDVAQAFVTLALAESTTGSVLTVDGGNIAASPVQVAKNSIACDALRWTWSFHASLTLTWS